MSNSNNPDESSFLYCSAEVKKNERKNSDMIETELDRSIQ
jgi:hypothetical protein